MIGGHAGERHHEPEEHQRPHALLVLGPAGWVPLDQALDDVDGGIIDHDEDLLVGIARPAWAEKLVGPRDLHRTCI